MRPPASFVGLAGLALLGPSPLSLGVSIAFALAAMHFMGCTHPPAASNVVIVFATLPDWDFLIFPTFLGTLLLYLCACAWFKAAFFLKQLNQRTQGE